MAKSLPDPKKLTYEEALEALRPLTIDCGPCERAEHGYRVHTDMTRFWWRPERIERQIEELAEQGWGCGTPKRANSLSLFSAAGR